MRSIIKRVSTGLIALALVGAGQLGMVTDAFADSHDPIRSVRKVDGVPDGAELVAENAESYYGEHGVTEYKDGIMLVFGKNDIWDKYLALVDEIGDDIRDNEEGKKRFVELLDDFELHQMFLIILSDLLMLH